MFPIVPVGIPAICACIGVLKFFSEIICLFGIYAPTIDLETPESLPEDILQDWDYASPLHINVCLPDPDPAWNPEMCIRDSLRDLRFFRHFPILEQGIARAAV